MSRDFRKLRAFVEADALVVDIYQETKDFPAIERYGLQAQIRRASISVATNLVEGSARRTTGEFVTFVSIAAGSAAEVRYLMTVGARLGYMPGETAARLVDRVIRLSGQLEALIQSLAGKPKT